MAFVSCNTKVEEKNIEEKVEDKVAKKPNILFIMTDDHAKRAMSIYDNSLIETPHLDRIGKEGIVFNRS